MPLLSRALSFPALLGLAWALTAAVLLVERWPEMAVRLFDADDAMRLVQVRDLIASRNWFDLHDARINPPAGYDTHWSRLIDGGLAGLSAAFRPFAGAAQAELLMRAVWPLLWLFVAMASVAALAWRIGGRTAALIALVLATLALPAFQHFKPGRIDHHNVQIALALAIVAAAAWADRARHAAALAGALTGLALAVGLENILFVALAGAALAVQFVVVPQSSARALARYGVALAASALIGFLLVVPPEQWLRPACDAMAVNWLLPVIVAGIGLGIAASRSPLKQRRARIVAVAIVGAAALLAFLAIEPRCALGPFALADDAVKLLWLNNVDETETLLSVLLGLPMTAAWLAAFPLVAWFVTLVLAGDPALRRDSGFLLAGSALTLAVVLTVGTVKLYAYAMWFGIPPAALLASRATGSSARMTMAMRVAATVLLTPTVITAAAILLAQTAGRPVMRPGMADRAACTRNAAYAALARLPTGLVATDINYGPFVLALTPHAVIAAPYHRLTGGVAQAHALTTGTVDAARAAVQNTGANYVAICGRYTSTGLDPAPLTLWAQLRVGRVPSWLEAVTPISDETSFAVYRVR